MVIDDRLPTINGKHKTAATCVTCILIVHLFEIKHTVMEFFAGELIYMRSKDKQEFWSALFEKAYAKYEIKLLNNFIKSNF